MWTFNFPSDPVLDQNGNVSVTVRLFKDNVFVLSRPLLVSSLDALKLQIKTLQDQADNGTSLIAAIKLGVADLTVTPTELTDVQKAQQAVGQLVNLKTQLEALGLDPTLDPTYVALQDAAKTIVTDGSVLVPTPALPIVTQPPILPAPPIIS